MMKQVILYVGLFDAAAIMLLGLIAAIITLMGWDARKFWDRIVPACGILIAASVAAVIVTAGTTWITG
jgi:hypothetical protein